VESRDERAKSAGRRKKDKLKRSEGGRVIVTLLAPPGHQGVRFEVE